MKVSLWDWSLGTKLGFTVTFITEHSRKMLQMQARYGTRRVFLEREWRGEAFNASFFLLSLHPACDHFTLILPNLIWTAASSPAGQSWSQWGNGTGQRNIVCLIALIAQFSSVHVLDKPLALFLKPPPQSQSRIPRQFKFQSPMHHSYLAGFNFHCSLTEGQINVVRLSCTKSKQKEQGIYTW